MSNQMANQMIVYQTINFILCGNRGDEYIYCEAEKLVLPYEAEKLVLP